MKLNTVLAGILLTGTALTACSPSSKAPSALATPAATSLPAASVVAEGRLEPVKWVEHSFGVAGTVGTVGVTEGQKVSQDQTLASLALSAGDEASIAAANAAALSAQQTVDKLTLNGPLDLATAQLAVLDAKDKLLDEKDRYKSEASLRNKARLDKALGTLAVAEDQVRRIESGGGIDTALMGPAMAQLDSAKAALVAARSTRVITAQMAGTVLGLWVQPGQTVVAGSPVITVADTSRWLVKSTNLTELQVTDVSLGQKVQVILDAIPGLVLDGKVSQISGRFEEKRGDITYTVTVALDSVDPAFRWGMTAAIRFLP